MIRRGDALAIIIVAHNSASSIAALLRALLQQAAADDELVVVDNLSSDSTAARAREVDSRIKVVESRRNLGFGGGCHLGARATTAPLLFFINPDCGIEPHCLGLLRATAASRPDWDAWQALVLLPDGRINTDGGVVHYTGIGWAGDCGKTQDHAPASPVEVSFPSGAATVIRRPAWDRLGGFDPSYFMYSEDLDLGLRLWLSGRRVGIVPAARVVHDYEFAKGHGKWYWLERNRWRTVLSVYPAPVLALVMPMLLATELVLLAVAARQGWLGGKLRSGAAGIRGLRQTLRRRRVVQAERRISAAAFSSRLSASLDSPYLPLHNEHWAVRLQHGYWLLVQRLLRRSSGSCTSG